MTDTNPFHQIALKSSLFKGRSDWYFSYLKSEKIAHVLSALAAHKDHDLEDLARRGSEIPQTVAQFAAGKVPPEVLLADIFSLISYVRLMATRKYLSVENSALLVSEYEQIVTKLSSGDQPSPFIAQSDFAVPQVERNEGDYLMLSMAPAHNREPIKDIYKGQNAIKDIQKVEKDSISQKDRSAQILAIVRQNKGVSIRDISASIRDCSEKTIQRELVALIKQGLVDKVGERRWSVYLPASVSY